MTENNAVTFDQAGFRAWLGDTGQGSVPELGSAYQRLDCAASWLVEITLNALRSTDVWAYGPGVDGLRVWSIASPEGGPDTGLTGEVNVDGVILSIGHLTDAELVGTEQEVLPGHEAAELALTALAEQINAVTDAFRASLGDLVALAPKYTGLSATALTVALDTLAELYGRDGVNAEDLSGTQKMVAEQVSSMWHAEQDAAAGDVVVVDAELVVDGEVAVYEQAAAAAGNDVNNPAHPTHW